MADSAYDEALLAAIYDDDNPDGPDHDYFRALADEVSAETVTDLGCGTGILTVTLAGPGRSVIGIDPAGAMLMRAAARPQGNQVEWRLGTSEAIDRNANDLIIMSGNVAMHILGEDWSSTLIDLAKGLKPGGKLAFETRNPQVEAWTTWNASAEIRDTAVGRLQEAESVTGPDSSGILTIDCSNDFIDAGRTIETSQRLQFRSYETLIQDLYAVGLSAENVWSDWHRTPFTGSASEPLLVVEAVKRTDVRSFYRWITNRYTGWTDSRTTSEEKSAAYHRNTGRQGGIVSGQARRQKALNRISKLEAGEL